MTAIEPHEYYDKVVKPAMEGRTVADFDPMTVVIGVLVTVMVLLVLFMGYLIGYGVGFYSVACSLDSAQPHCVQAGWGHAVKIERP